MGKTNTILTNFVVYYHVPSRLRKYFHITEAWDVIKWKHFPRYWPFVQGIHRSPVNSPHKGKWRGALMFSLICVWINVWVNNGEAGDLRRYRAHYDVIAMETKSVAMTRWINHDPWASFNENKRFPKMITKLVFENIWFIKHYITFCKSNIICNVKIV